MRVTATEIDALRYFMAQDDADPEKLVRQLRREEPATEAMEAGTAFHAAIESINALEEVETLNANGWTFHIEPSVEIELPRIAETRAGKDYQIDGVRVHLSGKFDAMIGKTIFDHKLSARFDPERYLDGYQWRCYLEIFSADRFVWNVFDAPIRAADEPMTRTVRDFHRLEAFRYPGMADDVEREVAAFVAFARDHLPERFA